MNSSEYIAGFFGIVIGLSLTELLRGVYKTIINSKKVIYFLPHAFGVATLFFTIIIIYFDYFRVLRFTKVWNPITLTIHSLPLTVVFFSSMLFFPSFKGAKVDFREFTKMVFPKLYLAGFTFSLFLIIRNNTILNNDPISLKHSIPLYFELPLFLLGWIFRKKDWVYYFVNIGILATVIILASVFEVS